MSIKRVVALRRRVKIITEMPRDSVMMNTLLLLTVVSESDLPTMTGKSGKMHGARIVSTPATNEMMRSVMLFYFRHQ